MKTSKNIVFVLGLVILALFIIACGGSASENGASPGQEQKNEKMAIPSKVGVVAIPATPTPSVMEVLDKSLCQNSGAQRVTVTFDVSDYSGWLPWYYANQFGILEKWGDKCKVDFVFREQSYVESIENFVDGSADVAVITNIEALNQVAKAGVDATVVVVGSSSNGNDTVVTSGLGLCDLAGRDVLIVVNSVSRYLLHRGFETQCHGSVSEENIRLIDVSESKVMEEFAGGSYSAVATWNPYVIEIIAEDPANTDAFNSSQIPNEILDLLIVKTEVVEQNPQVGEALVGAWYESLDIMTSKGPRREEAMRAMADAADITVSSFTRQLETTAMYWSAQDATEFAKSGTLAETMQVVSKYSVARGLLASENEVGIVFPDGSVQGDSNNIKLRFSDKFMTMAAGN